ncbi:MAG TPA: copper oxidase [Methylomirabilota bacterium]|nr:copper oxidase [Methylomirabilota bacterium]
MTVRRRNFLQGALGAAAGMLSAAWAGRADAQHAGHGARPVAGQARGAAPTGKATGTKVAVNVLDVPKLPYEMDKGVKVFRLVAEPVKVEFVPGKLFDVWGYNGSMPGPTIEVTEGDRVRVLFENRLPEPQTVHWHGLEVPIEMDGVPAISQPLVMPGEQFTYEFTLHQNGTFFYHTHMAMAEMIGLIGFFIIHPTQAYEPAVQKDFGIILQEWAVLPNNTVPNTLSMEFNWLTFNGKAGPAATPMLVKLGERVRIRIINIGMDHHPIHLHGMQFTVTGTESGRIPESARYQQNTVLVGVAQARDIEFVAKYPGDWMLHCHLPHHMMNQMVSMVGPMAHGGPLQTGKGMEEGMGIMKGHALSDENAPGFGRGMGMTTAEKPVSPMVGQPPHQSRAATPGYGAGSGQRRVPGFPQDMWMPMDEEVTKAETYGLPKDWSASLGGMMTLVRVLPPDKYDEIMALVKEAGTDVQAAPPQPRPTPTQPSSGGHRH